MMIAVIDYGMGNLRSVQKALEKAGANAVVTQKADEIKTAEKIVLPGVGAIKPAMERLQALDLINVIIDSVKDHKPFLGICLGFQLLFEKSFEGGEVPGLGILKGCVEQFNFQGLKNDSLKIPHMGWNQLTIKKNCPLYENIENFTDVYFCHSFYVKPENSAMIATSTNYGFDFASSIWQDNLYGVQFHPEKSQGIGLNILKNFLKI